MFPPPCLTVGFTHSFTNLLHALLPVMWLSHSPNPVCRYKQSSMVVNVQTYIANEETCSSGAKLQSAVCNQRSVYTLLGFQSRSRFRINIHLSCSNI